MPFARRPGNHDIELRDSDGHALYQERVAVMIGQLPSFTCPSRMPKNSDGRSKIGWLESHTLDAVVFLAKPPRKKCGLWDDLGDESAPVGAYDAWRIRNHFIPHPNVAVLVCDSC